MPRSLCQKRRSDPLLTLPQQVRVFSVRGVGRIGGVAVPVAVGGAGRRAGRRGGRRGRRVGRAGGGGGCWGVGSWRGRRPPAPRRAGGPGRWGRPGAPWYPGGRKRASF